MCAVSGLEMCSRTAEGLAGLNNNIQLIVARGRRDPDNERMHGNIPLPWRSRKHQP
jgi:hypothetical protein